MRNKEQWHKSLKEKYGDENYNLFGSESYRQNMINKYGVEYNTQVPEIKEKIKQTNLKKYGVSCNLQLIAGSEHSKKIWNEQGNIIREKIKNTSLQKYGVESPNQSERIKNKQKQSLINHYGNIENACKHRLELGKNTKLIKYGDANYHNKEKMQQTLLEKHIRFEIENNCTKYNTLLDKYGQGWKSLNLPIIYNGRFRYISNEYIPIIVKYSEEQHNLKSVSKQENELYEFIKSCTKYRIFRNTKNVIKDNNQSYELDIYIPKLNLAFEYNGNYWHSNLYKDKFYHQIKTKLCYKNNIQLIHIYEFEWVNNNDEIKKRIKNLFNGNNCSIYNWIPLEKFKNYILTEPKIIYTFTKNNQTSYVYNEGNFIKI